MKTPGKTIISKLLILLPCILLIQSYSVSARLPSRELKEEVWNFPKKDTLSLETMGKTKVFITGSNSAEIKIELKYIVRPDEEFQVKETQRTIYLKENILNYDKHRPTQSYFEECSWIIIVPHGMYIRCNGSSGDFEVNGFKGVFKADYALGKFVFNNVEGAINISQAILNAKIHNSKGSFNLSSAGGSIRATGLTIEGNSNFMSGMGKIRISLASEPEADLSAGSSFSKAKVSFNGNPLRGYFEFISRADEGKIISPFKFDKIETFLDDIKNYNTSSDFGRRSYYNRKSFTRGDSTPKITLKTVTGTAQLSR